MRRLLVVLAVLAVTGTLVAQTPIPKLDKVGTGLTTPPDVQEFSGDNVGIRVINVPGQKGPVQGSIVVKINGQWVEVVLSPKTVGAAK